MMRIRTLLTGGAIALAAGTVAIAGFWWTQPSPPAAASTSVPTAMAEITRGALVDTKTVSGTLGYGELSTLQPSLADGGGMLTAIAPVGATVERGAPLYAVDSQPAILFYGTVPQHRTLRFDHDAPTPIWVELETAERDVNAAELHLSLEQGKLLDAEARVADATQRLDDASSAIPTTAEFIQLSGAVRAAQAKLGRIKELATAELTPAADVAAAEAELASARAALDAAIRNVRQDIASAGLDVITARVAVAEAETKLGELRTTLAGLEARTGDDADVAQLADNLAALGYGGSLADQVLAWQRDAGLPVTGIVGPSQLVIASGPVHVAAHNASIGEMLTATSPDGAAILDYSSTEKLVTVALAVADRALAAVGRSVTITLPADSTVEGTISEIGSVVTDNTVEVVITIADQPALGALEVAAVDVEFVTDGREDVLSVPIAALLARPEGGFALELIADGRSTLVPVTTGLFAAGRVEVSGDGIAEGMRVGVPG
jgi:multidrug resistance efflux pump